MNFDLMSFAEFSNSVGARHYSFSAKTGFSSVAIDSRNVKEGSLFFAIEGAKSDGHSFVKDAFETGANAAVVETSKAEKYDLVKFAQNVNRDLIVVPNVLKALQDSARVYMEKFNNLIKIGITGSNGKTTVKEITASIISCEKNTVMSKGNLNSEFGLPLSIFEVRSHHEVGVFEMGMNRPNEIAEMAFILKPNIALVTNIGTAHIEYFGTQRGILEEKKSIYKYLRKQDIALVPAEDKFANELSSAITGKVVLYGKNKFSEFKGSRDLGLEGTEINWAGEKIIFPLGGAHNLENAFAAIAIAKEVSISNKAVKKGLEAAKPLFGRGEILRGRTTVIRDCYNASPESTQKGIEFCDSLEWKGRKIYVIADMLELGEASKAAHAQIGSSLAESKADKIFLFGNEINAACSSLSGKDFFYTSDINELSSALDCYVQEGDLVLLKGSRGLALERLSGMLAGDAGGSYVS